MCEDGSLFQTKLSKDIINHWKPLECTKTDPLNCGPTALALTGIKSRNSAQYYATMIENSGITLNELNKLVNESIEREEIQESPLYSLDKIVPLINHYLFDGNITLSALLSNQQQIGHLTTMAKINGNVVLFDGQTQQYYMGEHLDNYLSKYNHFYCMCSIIKRKRKLGAVEGLENRIRKKVPERQIKKKRTKSKTPLSKSLTKSLTKKRKLKIINVPETKKPRV
jgi:hypothetical protein